MESHKAKRLKKYTYGSKPMILLVVLIFTGISTASIYFYIHQLENTFLNNTVYYMNEIAEHDMKSIDQEINNQWERLETVGKKLSLERFDKTVQIQNFLNLETEATGFKELMLIDSTGKSYSSNYVVNSIENTDWGSSFLENKKSFVLRSQEKENYVVLYSNLLYGVSFEPVKVKDTTFIGVVGKYTIDSVKDSLKTQFFKGEGQAEVIGRDGVVITTDVTQRGVSIENVLKDLKKSKILREDNYSSIKKKLAAGKEFDTVYELNGETYIMSGKPLTNANWMVAVIVPYSVSSSQTMMFLKMTAVLLTILCVVIAIVLAFAFISFRRTMILNNSKEIFYRERLFNLLTNHTDDVFIIQDIENDRLSFISENAVRILGIAPKLGEKTELSFLDEENKKQLNEKVKKMKAKKSYLDVDEEEHEHEELEFAWIIPNSGEKKWMHMAIYNVKANFVSSSDSCLIIVISDFTQVKENQKKLEDAMLQAQDAAKSKTLFLSNMSHEMRTPLNGIVGCIQMMKTHFNEPKVLKKYLGKTESTAHYLISLVSDILDMSKIESHKMTLDERVVNLKNVIINIDTMFRSQMEDKGLYFEIIQDQPIYNIIGDEVRLQQILVNLLGNAQKFTNEGGKVSLYVKQELLDHHFVKTKFIVSDTGIGMSEAFMKRIWQPFEQERLDNARIHGGTGLGLAISRELATLMNGTITVTSKLNEGSCFNVEIIQPMAAENMDEESKTADIQLQNMTGYNILVAEDNELNREILTTLLRDAGANVIEAVNGREAVDRFIKSEIGEIHVILMDMQMPVMDGCTAAEEIRKLSREDAASVIIIACTANAFQEDIDRAIQSGMNRHIAKPLDLNRLLNIMCEEREENSYEKSKHAL